MIICWLRACAGHVLDCLGGVSPGFDWNGVDRTLPVMVSFGNVSPTLNMSRGQVRNSRASWAGIEAGVGLKDHLVHVWHLVSS